MTTTIQANKLTTKKQGNTSKKSFPEVAANLKERPQKPSLKAGPDVTGSDCVAQSMPPGITENNRAIS